MSKATKIYVLNGPNLNLLGDREPDIYGNVSLKDIEKSLTNFGKENNSEIYFKQTNHEGELIEFVHEASKKANAIIINPIAARKIEIQTLKVIFSLRKRNPNRAVKKGIAAKQSNVTAALVFVIE